jgi:hypothetical protein
MPQPQVNESDSPLWNAIKRLRRAQRSGADGRMIAMLQKRVDDEASKVAAKLPPGCRSIQEAINRLGIPPEEEP